MRGVLGWLVASHPSHARCGAALVMLTWQQRADLLAEARRRSPRREREAMANLIADAQLGAKAPRMSETDRARMERAR